MEAPAIPGYYFDPSTRKYFKVLPSWKAPAEGFVTQDAVRKRKREAEAERILDEARAQGEGKGDVRRVGLPELMWQSRGTASLKGMRCLEGALARLAASRLRPAEDLPFFRGAVSDFAVVGPHAEAVVVGTESGELGAVRRGQPGPVSSSLLRPRLPASGPAPRPAGRITSISLDPDTGPGAPQLFAATNLGAADAPGLVRFLSLGTDGPAVLSSWSPHRGSLFCSSLASGSALAGFTRGLAYFPSVPGAPRVLRSPSDPFSAHLAPPLAAAGMRDGRVLLWDLRERGQPKLACRHPGSTTAVTVVPGDRFLASAGAGGSAVLVDLRRMGKAAVEYPLPAHADPLSPVSLAVDDRARVVYALGEFGMSAHGLFSGTRVARMECPAGVVRIFGGEVWTASEAGVSRWAWGGREEEPEDSDVELD
ncbi:hypothetical protein DFJ74DRAFT_697700, partial [Hyaloraphidium curvatum]